MTVAEWHSASSIVCDLVQYSQSEIVIFVGFRLCPMAQDRVLQPPRQMYYDSDRGSLLLPL
jgi:hypothetical protein